MESFNLILNGIIVKQSEASENAPFGFYRLSKSCNLFDIQQTSHDGQSMFVALHDTLQVEEYGRTMEELCVNLHDRLAGRIKTAVRKQIENAELSEFDKRYLSAFAKDDITSVIFYPAFDEEAEPPSSSALPSNALPSNALPSNALPSNALPSSAPSSYSDLDIEMRMLKSNIVLLKKIIDHLIQ